MLVLRRKVGESIVIDGQIRVVINRIDGNRVSLGVVAPEDIRVLREELQAAVDDFRPAPPAPAGETHRNRIAHLTR